MAADRRTRLEVVRRGLFVAAAVLGIAASLFWLLSPVAVEHQVAQSAADTAQPTQVTTVWVTFYQAQGAWGLVVLLAFSLMYVLIAWMALRQQPLAAAAVTIVAVVLVYLSGFSIGFAYVPAVLLAALGWAAWGLRSAIAADGADDPANQPFESDESEPAANE